MQIYRTAATNGKINIDVFISGVGGTDILLNAVNNGNAGVGAITPKSKFHLNGQFS